MLHGVNDIFTCPIQMATSFVCASDLAVFQQVHELIRVEKKFVKILTQHCWAQVAAGMGFPEGNNVWVTP
jgi:hypothetical protein